MKILKFGGSSLQNPESINRVIAIILNAKKQDPQLAVVVSAFGGVTDQLIHIATLASRKDASYKELLKDIETRHAESVRALIDQERQEEVMEHIYTQLKELRHTVRGVFLIGEISLQTLDHIMSFGEQLSSYITAQAIQSRGVEAEYVDASRLVQTDDCFGRANVDLEKTYPKITDHFKMHPNLCVMGGFIGSTPDGTTTTLGRGGSDYTAALLGAALEASCVEIWTDVDGVMTADPRKVPNAFPVRKLTYEEAMELAHFGAKVIYPPTMQPARHKRIPLFVKNTFRPDAPGTLIGQERSSNDFPIIAISSMGNITLLRIQGGGMIGVPGVAARAFDALAKNQINVILITQASSEHSLCIAVDSKETERARRAIEETFALEIKTRSIDLLSVEKNLSIVAIVGENMRGTPGIAGRLLHALGNSGINVVAIAQGSSEMNISLVVNTCDETKALNVIHDAFFFPDVKRICLFLVGTGLIGKTLLTQISRQHKNLRKYLGLDLCLVGVANIQKMTFNENGIALRSSQQQLERGGAKDMEEFCDRMKKLGFPNSVFVDCTASEEVASKYKDILAAKISIVTPNKKANSGKLEQYKDLKNMAAKHGVRFLYETNVGAGLPVISTLRDLTISGDKSIKIEAVLSGTLSYIFNTFSTTDKKFSDIVAEAKERGYTEPDPRDDLAGVDVARKILILARESGLNMELEDVVVQPLVSEDCMNAESLEKFFIELKKMDKKFEQLRQSARKEQRVLRYIATLEGGNAQISLQEVGRDHPFYSLSGSDNIISFSTERYKETPLIVKGPGAGADVTAAGVLADIIRIFT